MQYLMVGLALALFYLLLLALSEHMSFDRAYAMSAGALVALITLYLTGVLRRAGAGARRRRGARDAVHHAVLDPAFRGLLAAHGLTAAVRVLAMLMIATRRIDWANVAPRSARRR